MIFDCKTGETLGISIAIVDSLNLEIRQADVSTAFLNADIKEETIVRPAESLELLTGIRSDKLWKLKEDGLWSKTVG